MYGSDRLEWYDAHIEVLVSDLHRQFTVHGARILSQAGPYLGAAMVLVALLVARRRGAPARELLRPLTALAVALLCVEFLKLAIDRQRPFAFGPAQHDSFPSGDTAQVALCAATALHLIALRRLPRDWLRWGMALVGATTAVAIAVARVYLGRHWTSDVAASLLLGILFWAVDPRRLGSVTKLAVAVIALVVVGMSGPRLVVPSPMTFDDQPHFELPPVAAGGQGDGGRIAWHFWTSEARYGLLQLELVPPPDDTNDWLDLEIDRDRVASVPLEALRSVYGFPFPRLTPGLHEMRLQTRQGSQRPLVSSLNLVRVSIEGVTGRVVVRALAARRARYAGATSFGPGQARGSSFACRFDRPAIGASEPLEVDLALMDRTPLAPDAVGASRSVAQAPMGRPASDRRYGKRVPPGAARLSAADGG
jgi:membrane-associated phospholipid phosphatase